MASLRPEGLSQALARGLAPIYLVSGDEPLLAQEACDAIRAAARNAGYSERELHHADAQFDWNQLLASARSLSLFADRKIIEIRLPSGKPGDKGGKALQEYAGDPPPDTILLLVTGKLEKSAQNTKWYKTLDGVGVHLTLWPIGPDKLPRWVNQRLQQAGLKADSGALDLLVSRVEGNLLAAVQEIEKLKLLAPDGVVSAELMAAAVADSARYDIFGLVDKALLGDARGTVKTLQGLRAEGTDVIPILWALTRDIRALVQIAEAQAAGQSFERAAQQAGVMPRRHNLLQVAARRLKPGRARQLLRKAGGVDKAVKGMRRADPWDELLDLGLGLAGLQSLSPTNEKLSLTP